MLLLSVKNGTYIEFKNAAKAKNTELEKFCAECDAPFQATCLR
jgi:hypothetical protein